jgi:serine protease Do
MRTALLRRSFFAVALWLSAVTLAWAASSPALPDFTALVASQGAAVVNISTVQPGTRKLPQVPFPGLDESDPMFEFFRRLLPGLPGTPQFEPDNPSLGSGFIISADGYILTNAHVVAEADEIVVRLSDRREFRARVVGMDKPSDVALIRIDASGLPRVTLGDPARLKVGEWVVAIGSPFGFEQSVTAGIVSAKGRSLPDENFVPFIQTDVAINPGNSGGPLFNLRGEVIGMNSQIYSRTGGFMGLSFAIPIDVAMNVQQQLRTRGRVSRGRIGVAVQELSRDLAEGFGLPRAAGALVSAIEADSPAARAGIEQGDVIVRFNGRAVDNSSDLPRIVSALQPGAKAAVQLYRAGVVRELTLTVGEWQDEEPPARRGTEPRKAVPPNRLGLVLVLPTPQQRRERGLEQGLIVERAQGPAARAEIRPGDAVLALVLAGRHTPLKTVEDFARLAADLKPGQVVTLLVRRGELGSYVSLRAEP